MTPRLPSRATVLLLTFGLVGAVSVLVATSRFGAGLSPDAVNYVVTAKNMLAGHGIRALDDLPMVVQPPLYPATLAILSGGRFDPNAVAPPLNAVLFAFIVCLAAILIRAWGGSAKLALLGAAFVLLSKPLFEVSLMAWSEPLFIFLTMIWLIAGARYVRQGSLRWLAVFGLAAAAASMTRYLGIALILTGMAIPLIIQRERVSRWRHLAFCGFISGLPLTLWLARNVFISGSVTGVRDPSSTSALTNLGLSFSRLSSWYMPPGLAPALIVTLTLGVGLFAALGAVSRGPGTWRKQLVLPLSFSCVYVAILIAAASTSMIDPIDNRLLAPIYVPVTLATLCMANAWFHVASRSVLVIRVLAIVVTSAWLVYGTLAFTRVVRHHARTGAGGYSTVAWRESPLIQYLRGQSKCIQKPLYSNSPEAIYALLGVKAKPSPRHDGTSAWSIQRLACLVWWDAEKRPFLASPEELTAVAQLRLERRLQNGTVYALSRLAR